MDLPEWIEQPVTQYPTDPIHDGVGKLITRCVVMEIFLRVRVTQLDAAVPDSRALKEGPTWVAERIAKRADLVPEDDRERQPLCGIQSSRFAW